MFSAGLIIAQPISKFKEGELWEKPVQQAALLKKKTQKTIKWLQASK